MRYHNALIRLMSHQWLIDQSHWNQRLLMVASACLDGGDSETKQGAVFPHRPESDANGNPIPKPYMAGDTAVIPVKGAMGKGVEPADKWLFGDWDYDDIAQDLKTAADSGAKRAMLHLNTPGGTVIGLRETASAIQNSPIPVGAFADSWATSAGYYLGLSASQFYATPSAIIGSVGTIMQRPDMTGLLDHFGVKVHTFTSGALKGLFNTLSPMSDAQKKWAQDYTDKSGAEFRAYVQERLGGGVPEELLQGQVIDASEAEKFGMITGTVPNLDAAIQQLVDSHA